MRVEVVRVANDGRTIRCDVSPGEKTEQFLTASQVVTRYDHAVESLPTSLLVIPTIGSLCPLAWGLGEEISVPVLDRTFADALPDIRSAFNELYPEWEFRGQVHADRYEKPRTESTTGDMLLFSGGVDSLASFIRHSSKDPLLTTIYPTDGALSQPAELENIREWVGSFADRTGVETVSIETNFRDIFDSEALAAHFSPIVSHGWWPNIQHGMALTTACAPTTSRYGVANLIIASSYTGGFNHGWGSHPTLDERIEWTGTTVSHDAWTLSRQEKINLLANYAETHDEALPVRSCWKSDDGLNCGRCEKCCRTILGLELAGLDAGNHGFDVPPEFFDFVRAGLQPGAWITSPYVRIFWDSLQEAADPETDYDRDGMNEFVDWFVSRDLESVQRQSAAEQSLKRLVEPVVPAALHQPAKRLGEPVIRRFMQRWY